MKLEVGKRYVLRNGEVTGYLHECRDTLQWMTDQYKSWLTNGGHYNLGKEASAFDIVAEYVEPELQQPLRWVENCVPDKPGIWAWQYTHCNSITNVSGIICESDLAHAASKGVRYCYLGQIPEILPPVKKVVERLWLLQHGISTYTERWVSDDSRESLSGDWIRTDRTREVEQ